MRCTKLCACRPAISQLGVSVERDSSSFELITFSLTLGQVYALDLKINESRIKEVVMQAQGEVSPLIIKAGTDDWF